ncbi:MAG: carbon-nitrogen hydrolase family protein [Planctomycetaceae bacterium]|nr:carbon-nitrogen hydrolase family protein [Planctomycetaceae bacterium]
MPLLAARAADEPRSLKVAVVQLGMEPTLAENRDKIARLTGEAAAAGARLVVFPEGALAAPPGNSREEYDAAAAAVGQAARDHRVYVATGARHVPAGQTRHHNQLFVFSPQGQTLLVYDKVWHARKYDAPKIVEIDGVPASFIICADRWSRPVESLPPAMGAKILIECSNNFDNEWLPALEWYWYVPHALRHTAFVVFANSAPENRLPGGNRGHGHSALIAPDGSLLASAAEERDKIVLADLDLAQATLDLAIRRSQHPLFKAWWEMGRQIHSGKDFPLAEAPVLVSSNSSVKCGFARMSCTSSIEQNVKAIQDHIRQAAAAKLDLVVFPELAVTGDRQEDIERADAAALTSALDLIRRSAQEHQVTAVVGAPSLVGGKRRNSAYTIGPDGSVLTRYDQIAVGRPDLFEGGLSTKAMWFQVNGVWSLLTIGDDALWTEMAELAALRGARLHCHLCCRQGMNPAEALLHDQIMANLASFRTLTVVGSPLHSSPLGSREHYFLGSGSAIWDDLEAGNWCAVKIQSGRPWDRVFSSPRIVPGPANPMRQSGYWLTTTPRYKPWMMAGVAAMDQDLAAGVSAAGGRK